MAPEHRAAFAGLAGQAKRLNRFPKFAFCGSSWQQLIIILWWNLADLIAMEGCTLAVLASLGGALHG